jgi:hypothetical protein
MAAPDLPLAVVLLGVLPLFYAVGRFIGDVADYFLDPPPWDFDWSKFGGLVGGAFGLGFYLSFLLIRALV